MDTVAAASSAELHRLPVVLKREVRRERVEDPLERQAARIVEATSKAPAADPNEIDLDDDDSDDDGEQVLSTKPVPAAVFGSAAAQAAEMSEPQGALARFQKKAS